MLLAALSVLVLLIFLFTDAWYFLRFIFGIQLRPWKKPRNLSFEMLEKPVVSHHIVLPSDLDVFMHMNNSKYLRESDFGRINYLYQLGLLRTLRDLNINIVAASISIRYRRELRVFQTYNIETRWVHWDDKCVYLEQRFIRKGFVHAISFVQARFIGGSPRNLVEGAGIKDIPSKPPVMSEEIVAVVRFNEASSSTLNPARK